MVVKQLFVFTQVYTFGSGESFIENEAPYWDGFDLVYVCPLAVKKDDRQLQREMKSKKAVLVDLHYADCAGKNNVSSLVKTLFSKEFLRDITRMMRKSVLKANNIKRLLSLNIHTRNQVELLNVWLIEHNQEIYENAVFYGYWLYEPAMAAVLMKKTNKTAKIVCRTHGFDLYEERHDGYLPYRQWFLSKCDRLAAISQDGYKYLAEHYPKYADRLIVSRLGTVDYGIQKQQRGETIQIVSCSNCISVKRVDKIIDSLALMVGCGLYVNWTHFGDGVLMNDLKLSAEQKLKDNVEFTFAGRLTNTDLMTHYHENYCDVFVNVSESEGIPVSIMEAMSFGIPVIATDVGGTNELVLDEETGYLLSPSFTPDDLEEKIIRIAEMSEADRVALRNRVRKHWKASFSATENYRSFINTLNSL